MEIQNLRWRVLAISSSILRHSIHEGFAARGLSHMIIMLDFAVVNEKINRVHVSNGLFIDRKEQSHGTQRDENYLYHDVGSVQRFRFFVMNYPPEEK